MMMSLLERTSANGHRALDPKLQSLNIVQRMGLELPGRPGWNLRRPSFLELQMPCLASLHLHACRMSIHAGRWRTDTPQATSRPSGRALAWKRL